MLVVDVHQEFRFGSRSLLYTRQSVNNWRMSAIGRLQRFGWARRKKSIDRAVAHLVRHAYKFIPYYHNLLDHRGVNPATVRTAQDLRYVPITERETLSRLTAAEHIDPRVTLERCFCKTTSGTSGIPLKLYMRRTELAYRRLSLGCVLLQAAPLLPPFRIVEIGRTFSPGKPTVHRVPGLLTVVTPPGQAEPSEQLECLKRYRPQIVEGFPTALEVLARACRKQGWSLPTPRLVVSRGEVLFPDVRQLLESTFKSRVIDHYNCEEIGNVAWECPLDPERMHINQNTCVVEIVDPQGNCLPAGDTGLVALTNLYNFTMPFIRYILGDRGRLLADEPGSCACGARAPSMALLDGREDDILRLPGGQFISPRVVVSAMFWRDGEAIHGIHRYQLVQDAVDRLEVRVVLDEDHASDWKEALVAGARRVMEGVSLDIREVDDIHFDYSGKYKRVVSTVTDLTH